jgi:hypothetical protein
VALSRLSRWLISALAGAAMCAAAPALAQDTAKARQLFDEGMELMRKKDFQRACVRFEESLAEKPLMTTSFRLAECYEVTERPASAYRYFREVGEQAELEGLPDRAKFANERAAALKPKLSRLTVVVTPAASGIDGLRVTVDGKSLSADAFGQARLVDPGGHVVEATAPGFKKWSKATYVAGSAQELVVEVPGLLEPGSPDEPDDPIAPPPDEGDGSSSSLGPYHIAAIVLGGVGVGAMGAGVGLGFAADAKHQEAADRCLPEGCAQPELDEQESAVTLGNVGTAVFFVGVAAVAGGAVLWFVAPDDSDDADDPDDGSSARLGVAPYGAGAQLKLEW